MNRPRGLAVVILIPLIGRVTLGQAPTPQPGRASQPPSGAGRTVAPPRFRLVDDQGRPVAGAVVGTSFSRDADREATFTPPAGIESWTSDERGEVSRAPAYGIRQAGAGIYAIRQDKDRPLVGVSRLTRVPPGTPETIVMHPACRVRLRIVCPGFRALEEKYHAELGGPSWWRAAMVLLGE